VRFLEHQTFTLKYAVSALNRRRPGRAHKRCTDDECSRDTLNELKYEPLHRVECEEGKDCWFLEAEGEDGVSVARVLEKGEVPVVRFDTDNGRLEVLSAGDQSLPQNVVSGVAEYVAISHVWSE